MPNRIIKESICTSDTIAQLSQQAGNTKKELWTGLNFFPWWTLTRVWNPGDLHQSSLISLET